MKIHVHVGEGRRGTDKEEEKVRKNKYQKEEKEVKKKNGWRKRRRHCASQGTF